MRNMNPVADTARESWALMVLLLADQRVTRALLDALGRWPASRTTRHLIEKASREHPSDAAADTTQVQPN